MTDEERHFTRDFEDLILTLLVSLSLSAYRVRFTKVENTFTSEEAINNLGSLKSSQSRNLVQRSLTSSNLNLSGVSTV